MPTGIRKTVDSIRRELMDGFSVSPKGCYEWQGALNPKGYGRIRYNSKILTTHRLSYNFWVGPIEDNLFVCHSCDNRKCIRPSHLFLGTAKDNTQDAVSKRRLNRGSRLKISDAQVLEIRLHPGKHADIAELYGITKSHVRHIKHLRVRSDV